MIIIADGSVKIEVLLDDSKVSGGVKRVEGRLGGIGGAAKRGLATVGKLAGALGLVGLAYKGIDMVKNSLDGAIDRYDTLNNFPKVMQQMGFDAEESQVAIDKLSDGIQGLPTRLDEVASTAQNIAVMTGDLDGAVDTTLALNNAFLASGASTADAQRGLDQYVQMLSKGEVDLQSWRTLQETMPYALRKTAEAFGFTGESATNDFYDALKAGDITMSEFNDKLIELDTAQGGFAETAQEASGGIRTAWTNMSTWIVTGVADVIGAIDEALGGTGEIENAINRLKPIVQGVFGWMANTAIPAVGNAIQFLKDKFDEYRPAVENVIEKMEPLLQVFQETRDELMEQFAPIWENLKGLLEDMMPILEMLGTLIGGVLLTAIIVWTSALNGVAGAIGPVINTLISLVDFIVNVVNAVIAVLTGDFTGALEYWNAATEASVEFFKSLWDGIVGFVMGIVDAVVGWFESLYDILVGNSIIPDMVNAIIDWFGNLLTWAVEKVTELVNKVVKFFTEMKDKAIAKATEFVTNAREKFEQIKKAIVDKITEAKNNLVTRFTEMVTNAIRKATEIVNNVRNKFNEVKQNITNKIDEAKTALVNKFTEMVTNVRNKAVEIVTTARQKFEEVKQAIRNKLTEAVRVVGEKISEMPGKVREKVGDMILAGIDLMKGLVDGIKNMGRAAIEAVTGVVGGVIKKAKSLLKISSPSKLFEQFGEWTSEGLAKGIDDMRSLAEKASENLGLGVEGAFEPQLTVDGVKGLSQLKGINANSLIGNLAPINLESRIIRQTSESRGQSDLVKNREQPAYITLVLGGREYSAFVRDITETQERTRLTLEAFRG